MTALPPLPLPADPALASAAAALEQSGHWADVVDDEWRYAFMTGELRIAYGGFSSPALPRLGTFYFGPDAERERLSWPFGPSTVDIQRRQFAALGSLVLHDLGIDRAELRAICGPSIADLAEELPQLDPQPMLTYTQSGASIGGYTISIFGTAIRVHDRDGRLVGTALVYKPTAGMAIMSALAAHGDPRHIERVQSVAKAGRRPAAILFADLESSAPLARRLPTAGYFALGRRLFRAFDRCIVDAGGMPGRQAGDGIVAFFLAETAGSESAAARACVTAARTLREAVADVALRSEIEPGEVVLRFGMHWGSTLYVGQVITAGRSEVTALGDEVNETARIEACASGGRALASKALIERLDAADSAALGLDPDRIVYTALGDVAGATEKARRDAPAIAVCEV